MLYSCNLGFRNTDLRALVGARLGKEVYVENDANAAAFGEVLAGAGKGYRDVVVVTLGTGVGGGIIIDGKIYTGFNFCGAELGHTVIQYGGRQCGCRKKGLLRGLFLCDRPHQYDPGIHGSPQGQQDVGDLLRQH